MPSPPTLKKVSGMSLISGCFILCLMNSSILLRLNRLGGILLGIQTLGSGGDKRVDVAATAIAAGMTVDQVAHLDLCYAPPFSPAMDNLITAADIARNKLDGNLRAISPTELWDRLQRKEEVLLLEETCRGGARFVNRFWADARTGGVFRSEQWIGEGLPALRMDYVGPRPPSDFVTPAR